MSDKTVHQHRVTLEQHAAVIEALADANAEVQRLRENEARMQTAGDRLRGLLAELADPEWHGECRLDHHGYCQEHGYMATDPPCPYRRAREALRDA